MQADFTLAITGDSILNRRLSVHNEDRFLSLVKILRDADVAYTNLEMLIHDYEGPELYPAAEAASAYARSPHFTANELKWAGFDIVSTACNHSLDYSYGGLFSTWAALDEAGLVHAGTGMNLAEAREPAYLDTGKGRVALISMCSSFVRWARAGEIRRDVKGRPGLNPLRFYYKVDGNTIEMLKQLATKFGWSITQTSKMWLFFPAGTAMSFFKFVESDEPGVTPVADEDDVEGNLRSIREARRQADYVLSTFTIMRKTQTRVWILQQSLCLPLLEHVLMLERTFLLVREAMPPCGELKFIRTGPSFTTLELFSQ